MSIIKLYAVGSLRHPAVVSISLQTELFPLRKYIIYIIYKNIYMIQTSKYNYQCG
jgi:hypothetical protein